MQVTVPASVLSAALKHAVSPRTSTMPILQHALLVASGDHVDIETSDCEIFVRQRVPATVEAEGGLCLSVEHLRSIASGSGDVHIRGEGRVTRGRSHYTVANHAADDFPAPEEARFDPIVLDPLVLAKALAQVAYAYNDEDVRPFVGAVHIDPGCVWSTNGYQAGRAALPGYDGPSVRIPGAQVARVQAALVEGATLSVALAPATPPVASMLRVEGEGTRLIVRCVGGGAPNIAGFIPRFKEDPAVLPRDELIHALRRLLPFTPGKGGKVDLPMVFTASAQGLVVSSRDESAFEHIAFESAPEFPDAGVRTGLSARQVIAALAAIETDTVDLWLSDNFGPNLLLPHNGDVDQVAHVIQSYRL